jgi:hypothetical protein
MQGFDTGQNIVIFHGPNGEVQHFGPYSVQRAFDVVRTLEKQQKGEWIISPLFDVH